MAQRVERSLCASAADHVFPSSFSVRSALYDMAQLRFAKTSKLGSNWYVRSDGTRSYFFTVDELCTLLRDAGFEILESTCVKKNVVNRKEKSEMSRRFVQVRARAVDRKVDIPQAEPVAIASSSDPAQAHTSDPQP
jgi:hypothetical protein